MYIHFWDLFVYFSVGFQTLLLRNTLSSDLPGICPSRAL